MSEKENSFLLNIVLDGKNEPAPDGANELPENS